MTDVNPKHEALKRDHPDAVAALNHLAACIWYLLEKHDLLDPEGYTFPDGERWTREELEEWKAAGYKMV